MVQILTASMRCCPAPGSGTGCLRPSLVDGGVDNLQSELFTNNSEEWEVITRENDRLKEKLKAYEPIIDKLAEVRQGVFQIKQEDSGWVLSIMKAHPLSDDIG